MAKAGEYGIFTPSEAAYAGPGQFEKMVLGEAIKRGTYLSQMDQFYAQLEEMEREFTEKLGLEERRLGFEEKKWGEELGWLREQEAGRLGLAREQTEAQKYIARLGAGGGKSVAEKRREAAGWNVPAGGKATEGEVPLSWLSEQLGRLYPEAGGAGTTEYGAPSEIYFSNPALGTREKV